EGRQRLVEDTSPPASAQSRRPVCMDLRCALGKLRGSAPGANGWHEDEPASLYSPAVVSHLADVSNFMLDQRCVPTEWRKARQVMLQTGTRKRDGSNAVQALRPITILSCWRSLLSSVLQLPDVQAGEVYTPLLSLLDSYHEEVFIASYDYTLAFDKTDSRLAIARLGEL
ncbi:unnamed protein product, partial [Prorocentrum cordatum]